LGAVKRYIYTHTQDHKQVKNGRKIKYTKFKRRYCGLYTPVETFLKKERYIHFQLSVRIRSDREKKLRSTRKVGESNTN